MKTCSFRPSLSPSTEEHLFATQVPEARFGTSRCRDLQCRLCYERSDLTDRIEPVTVFSPQQVHRFVSGYWVYLNADVVCLREEVDERTKNETIDCLHRHVKHRMSSMS